VLVPLGMKICQISCGAVHSLALSEKGNALKWGAGRLTKLILRNVVAISAGAQHSAFID
jgi:alpha-tubulin suppressor-like RCC1 family protein